MPAKQLMYGDDARHKILVGVNKLVKAVKSTLGPLFSIDPLVWSAIGGVWEGVIPGLNAGEEPMGLSIRLATPARFSRAEPDPFENDPRDAFKSIIDALRPFWDKRFLLNDCAAKEVAGVLMEV